MSLIRTGINFTFILFSVFLPIRSLTKEFKLNTKVHDYSQLVAGKDYILEIIDEGMEAYMTGTGKGIKLHDHIILKSNSRYKVESIDYYTDPSDMWIALLKQVKFE
ncbi:hypothetical protein H6G41_20375 [Tolypothrix sp. FACHB-123]|uniref:hypothetical protein n=1 Tax=Tolypothrix sp. FACHB-123 TaxID=2692868 RepID=UPI0016822601|nr:hypothetical protein [Tolypothrix sp. FACHB-123]MBD2356953.1 hypothetical protein [Tolypothrix sp. FACHB-123]